MLKKKEIAAKYAISTIMETTREDKVTESHRHSISAPSGGLKRQTSLLSDRDCTSAVLAARSWLYHRRKHSVSVFKMGTVAKVIPYMRSEGTFQDLFSNANAKLSLNEVFAEQLVTAPAQQSISLRSRELNGRIARDGKHLHPLGGTSDTKLLPSPFTSRHHAAVTQLQSIAPNSMVIAEILPIVAKDFSYKKNFRRGVTEYKKGQYTNALSQFQNCIHRHVDSENKAVVYKNHALTLYQLGRFKASLKSIHEAIRYNEKDSSFFAFRSRLYQKQELYILAGKDAERVKKMKQRGNKVRPVISKKFRVIQNLQLLNSRKTSISVGRFDMAYQTAPKARTAEEITYLVSESYRFSCLAQIDAHRLTFIWRNIVCRHCNENYEMDMGASKNSLFIVVSGTFEVLTSVAGFSSFRRTLGPGACLSRSDFPTNMWPATTLISKTRCTFLTLEDSIYKYAVKFRFDDRAEIRYHALLSTNIFTEWTDGHLRNLAILSEDFEHNSGEVLAHEGDLTQYLFLVLSGMASVVKSIGATTDVQLGTLASGDIFGESSVINPIGGRFPATVITLTAFKVLRIDKDLLNRREGLDIATVGKLTQPILARIQKLAVTNMSDRQLIHCIESKCSWERTRRKVITKIVNDARQKRGEPRCTPHEIK